MLRLNRQGFVDIGLDVRMRHTRQADSVLGLRAEDLYQDIGEAGMALGLKVDNGLVCAANVTRDSWA